MAEKGAKGPIFEGNILPQKCTIKIGANIGAIIVHAPRNTDKLELRISSYNRITVSLSKN
jgi:hypothetical protein